MDLTEVRTQIDDIDSQLLELFEARMDLARCVAEAKRGMKKAVFDPARERDKLSSLMERAPKELQPQVHSLFSLLMTMNKAEQQRILHADDSESLSARARKAMLPVDETFPALAHVACQGVEGAYSQIAACKLFTVPSISYFTNFEGVFKAVQSGFCEYGVLPIENSTAGSVNQVYDLLAKYRFHIVRGLRLKIDHQLLAKPSTRLEDVKEICSHQQAIAQCASYIEGLGADVTVMENTAMAAQAVAHSERQDLAALSSRACAELYGLETLDADVQDTDSNYTRFVVISATPQIYPGANRTSLLITLKHEPGSLYRVLERFYALDINMVKLESRPIPGRDFEFRFYFDLEAPAGSQVLGELLDSLDEICDQAVYFGTYTEVL